MSAPDAIRRLVEQYEAHRDAYRSAEYHEAQLRQEFLNPFFHALGWDVYNEKGYSDAYKEVIHEAAIKVGGRTKAPDYCFRAGGGKASFFVEAKKPAVDIGEAIDPAYQLRRYAWSAKLPVSILTDFEELAVYDCRIRPVRTDKATVARVLYCTCQQYAERWEELQGLFSPEAIRRGALEKFVASQKVKKGTAEVDAAFLTDIEGWRDVLARNVALRNPRVSQGDLNFAVQRTIDRLVFLRICEDRGIEPYGTLQGLANGTAIYRRLAEVFERADERYNSGLFHFSPEKDRIEPPDEITLPLTLDDEPLKQIIQGLYYPESPYEFSVLPVEILGQVYEQFLGKVIRLTKAHQAKVEEKPEVRKAGGVYYTPAYIVDYIVEHTLGKLLAGRPESGKPKAEKPRPLTPAQAAKLRILDPACGSGSFLIGAYQRLLDWHRDQYVADDPERHARARSPRLYRGAAGEWRLTTGERKRILLNNIYGVDIDPQAVEVTKLSLLLKVLEGESKETVNNQLRLFHERALPDLGRNIKCGNSLVGPDFYEGRQKNLFDEGEMLRINAFDWRAEFSEVFRGPHPGFHAVIGNPPYVSIRTMTEMAPATVAYYNDHYVVAGQGSYDIYVVFVERGLSLLHREGLLGFILPSKFFATDYGEPLRKLLSSRAAVAEIVDFRHGQVFLGATTYTCLLFLSSAPRKSLRYSVAFPPESLPGESSRPLTVKSGELSGAPWVFARRDERAVLRKLEEASVPLLGLPCGISRGSSTGADDVFILSSSRKGVVTRDGESVRIEREILRTPLYATDFRRYCFAPARRERVIFPYRLDGPSYRLLDEAELASDFPKAYAYLRARKKVLLKRRQFSEWFGFSAPRNLELHDQGHLMVPLLANTGSYCRLPSKMRQFCPMASAGFTIHITPDQRWDPRYVLGLLNSRLLFWMLSRISNVFRGGWITCTKQYVGKLPIRILDVSKSPDRNRHDRMVGLVEGMLGLHQRLRQVRTEHGKTVLHRQIEAADRQIDQLVYELYGLSKEEIKLVEEGT